MSAAVDLITDRVRERVRREGVDLAADAALADRFVREELRSYSERALGGSAPLVGDEQSAARQIIAAVTGLGPLQPYLDDPEVEELWINAPDGAFLSPTCVQRAWQNVRLSTFGSRSRRTARQRATRSRTSSAT